MSTLPPSPIPIFTTVADYREWRRKAFIDNKSVGFVPTMGALHDGHLCLVRRSLQENDLTVLSIFVNPAQFAPHEDLAIYPRTLERDLQVLMEQRVADRKPSAVFLPTVKEMYPGGIHQDVAHQKGSFVEVKGYSEQMEGKSRPTFFRGVATVVTKLFNAIEPTNAYFGQKDIQQAFLLRRMVTDLLLSHPSPDHLHIVPTARDATDNLALSSRNVHLSPEGRKVAPVLYASLRAAEDCWNKGGSKAECIDAATNIIQQQIERVKEQGTDVRLKLDYIEMNDAGSFEVLGDNVGRAEKSDGAVILSGAIFVDQTRLIDNILLGSAV
ncbi:hypothetical protein GYMLUDRAFT_65266 [Collybiopsis luxurians FD-317 M1]|uniref:Pantoate--beta-alanine ligase n=1 Tax=Collybiopsis luxurians FD-317 M1 TaxID=944289 RepID=A0A0D0BM60_9AGAR|nr:hypothetical protein GYMLUDRAFT_65266 [Collybiopsis luxurians FD-317 M1]